MSALAQRLPEDPKRLPRIRDRSPLERRGSPPELLGHLSVTHVNPPALGQMVRQGGGNAQHHLRAGGVAQLPAQFPETHPQVGPIIDDVLWERLEAAPREQKQVIRQMGGLPVQNELFMEAVVQLPQQSDDVPHGGGSLRSRQGTAHHGDGAGRTRCLGKQSPKRSWLGTVVGVQEGKVVPGCLPKDQVQRRNLPLTLRLRQDTYSRVPSGKLPQDLDRSVRRGARHDPQVFPAHPVGKLLAQQRGYRPPDRGRVVERRHPPADPARARAGGIPPVRTPQGNFRVAGGCTPVTVPFPHHTPIIPPGQLEAPLTCPRTVGLPYSPWGPLRSARDRRTRNTPARPPHPRDSPASPKLGNPSFR